MLSHFDSNNPFNNTAGPGCGAYRANKQDRAQSRHRSVTAESHSVQHAHLVLGVRDSVFSGTVDNSIYICSIHLRLCFALLFSHF